MARTRSATQPVESSRSFKTPEAQENYLISLANSLAEQRLKDGTASSQEVTHFLKLGSSNAKLERDRMIAENALLQAKTEALEATKHSDELYSEAIAAFRKYSGYGGGDEYEDY